MSIIKVVLKIYLSMTFLFYVPWGGIKSTRFTT